MRKLKGKHSSEIEDTVGYIERSELIPPRQYGSHPAQRINL